MTRMRMISTRMITSIPPTHNNKCCKMIINPDFSVWAVAFDGVYGAVDNVDDMADNKYNITNDNTELEPEPPEPPDEGT